MIVVLHMPNVHKKDTPGVPTEVKTQTEVLVTYSNSGASQWGFSHLKTAPTRLKKIIFTSMSIFLQRDLERHTYT